MKPYLPRISYPLPRSTEYDMILEDLLGKFFSIMEKTELSTSKIDSARFYLDKASKVYGYTKDEELRQMYLEAVDRFYHTIASQRHSFHLHGLSQPIRKKRSYRDKRMSDPTYSRFYLLRKRFYDTLYKTAPYKRQELIDWFQGHPDYIAWKAKERKV